jgi:hypothetical protein
MTVNVLGLAGALGPLPAPFSELLLDCAPLLIGGKGAPGPLGGERFRGTGPGGAA